MPRHSPLRLLPLVTVLLPLFAPSAAVDSILAAANGGASFDVAAASPPPPSPPPFPPPSPLPLAVAVGTSPQTNGTPPHLDLHPADRAGGCEASWPIAAAFRIMQRPLGHSVRSPIPNLPTAAAVGPPDGMAIWAAVHLGPRTGTGRPAALARRDFITFRRRPMDYSATGDAARGWPSWPTVPAFTGCAWRKFERRILHAAAVGQVSIYFRFSGYGVGGDRRRPRTAEVAFSWDQRVSKGRYRRIHEARGFPNA